MKPTKRQLQKDATRQLILETAYTVYCEEGFSATTSRVAKSAGISHGTIFAHFSTVELLLTALLEQFGSKVGEHMHALADKDNSLESLLSGHIEILSLYEDFYRRLITEAVLLPEQAKFTYIMIQSTVSIHLSRAFEAAAARGTAKALPAHIAFNTWLGLLHYYLSNQGLFAPEGSVLKRYGKELVDNYLKILAP